MILESDEEESDRPKKGKAARLRKKARAFELFAGDGDEGDEESSSDSEENEPREEEEEEENDEQLRRRANQLEFRIRRLKHSEYFADQEFRLLLHRRYGPDAIESLDDNNHTNRTRRQLANRAKELDLNDRAAWVQRKLNKKKRR